MKYLLVFLSFSFIYLNAFEQLIDLEKIGGTNTPNKKVIFKKPITKKKSLKTQILKKNVLLQSSSKTIKITQTKILEAFITPMELKKLLNDKELVVIDADTSSIYRKGHIDSAINVNVKNFIRIGQNPYKLMKSDSIIKNKIIDLGINKNSKVIIYAHNNENGTLNTSYLAFILITFGFENVSILDGGYMAWVFENERLVSSKSSSPKNDGNFIPEKNPNILVNQDYVINNISKSTMLDARETKYYYGTQKSLKTKTFGHISKAKSSYYRDKFHLDGTLRDKNELNDIYFNGFEITKNDEIIIYADNIFKASMEWYMLYKVMKLKNIKIYEASLLEYFKTDTNPTTRFKWE